MYATITAAKSRRRVTETVRQGGVYDNLDKQLDGSFKTIDAPVTGYAHLPQRDGPVSYAQPDLYDAPVMPSKPNPQFNIDGTEMYDNGDYRRRRSEPMVPMAPPGGSKGVYSQPDDAVLPQPILPRPQFFEVNSTGKPSPWNTLKLAAEKSITPDTSVQNTPNSSRRGTPIDVVPQLSDEGEAVNAKPTTPVCRQPSPSYAAVASSPPTRRRRQPGMKANNRGKNGASSSIAPSSPLSNRRLVRPPPYTSPPVVTPSGSDASIGITEVEEEVEDGIAIESMPSTPLPRMEPPVPTVSLDTLVPHQHFGLAITVVPMKQLNPMTGRHIYSYEYRVVNEQDHPLEIVMEFSGDNFLVIPVGDTVMTAAAAVKRHLPAGFSCVLCALEPEEGSRPGRFSRRINVVAFTPPKVLTEEMSGVVLTKTVSQGHLLAVKVDLSNNNAFPVLVKLTVKGEHEPAIDFSSWAIVQPGESAAMGELRTKTTIKIGWTWKKATPKKPTVSVQELRGVHLTRTLHASSADIPGRVEFTARNTLGHAVQVDAAVFSEGILVGEVSAVLPFGADTESSLGDAIEISGKVAIQWSWRKRNDVDGDL